MFKEHHINEQLNFIGGWYISPDLCDEIVGSAVKKPAFFSDVTDYYSYRFLHQLDKRLFDRYVDELTSVTKLYTEKYPNSLHGAPWRFTKMSDDVQTQNLDIPGIKFQKYYPNRFYSVLHCENDGNFTAPVYYNRHLVFMTYLNDIQTGGGTEFPQQNFVCKPEKGLTLIWPAHWTHMHKGEVAPNETKYILTGWYIRDLNLTSTF